MKLLARHDTLIAVIGTAVLTVGYYWSVVYPGRVTAQKIEAEIAQSQAKMGEIPTILAEQSRLQKRLEQQREQLVELEDVFPTESHVSEVLHQVASQARRAGLMMTRLEPLPSIDFAAYSAQPFHLSCRGSFENISEFLSSLETQSRLVTFGKVDFTRGNEGPTSAGSHSVQANFDFSVFSRHAKSTKVAENTASRTSLSSDK